VVLGKLSVCTALSDTRLNKANAKRCGGELNATNNHSKRTSQDRGGRKAHKSKRDQRGAAPPREMESLRKTIGGGENDKARRREEKEGNKDPLSGHFPK